MNAKSIAVFFGGALAAVIVMGMFWYWEVPMGFAPGPGQQTGMAGMDGMEMGGMESPTGMDQAAVMISPSRRQLIGVKTETVKEENLETVIRTVGTVDYDERRIRQINLRVSGWITKLFVDYTGKAVSRGDPLFTLYSPDLVATQEEYLLAQKTLERVQASPLPHVRTGAESQLESARNRLLLWNLTEDQIARLEQDRRPRVETTIYSPLNGVVTRKMALQGMYATPDMNLYEIADLSVIWVHADIYEYELPLVKLGQTANVTLTSYPGEIFKGKVVYVYPFMDKETRTVKVRIEFPNPQGKLKPGMYGNVEIRVEPGRHLAVPQSAVLDSGIRKLVYVDLGGGMYEPREVTLGNRVHNYYSVQSGLEAGEKVVTSGTFLIDSESKLMAATSMMGMLGMGGIKMEQAQMGEMEMGGMPMGEKKAAGTEQTIPSKERTVDGLTVGLTTDPEPPKKGKSRVRMTVHDQGAPVTGAEVSLAYTMAMPGMEMETATAIHTQNGIYEAEVDFAMRGAWELEVRIHRQSGKPLVAKFTVTVK